MRSNFGSKIGMVLASAGSAVGLGNIWRFPTEAGRNGGAAFMLLYLACVLLLAMPVMIGEFVIGRASRANTVDSYRVLAPGKHWVVSGFLGVIGGFLVLSYYSVVAGWTLDYTVMSFSASLMKPMDYGEYFSNFVQNPWRPVLAMAAFMAATHFVVSRGVEKGIERFSKILMPMLFCIILVLIVCSLNMPGAGKGLEFLFKPDFSKVDIQVALSAMGQAFFTLSVGIGCLATYASYFSDDTPLVRVAFNVCMIDTLVAISAGLIIFPAVFSVSGAQVDVGPGLVFITLPNVFNSAFGSLPVLNYIFSSLFYMLLFVAALTSSISMHEISTAYITETFHLERRVAACIVTGICMALGVACSLSFGAWSGIQVFGMGFFDLFDYFVAKFCMPLGGIMICTFVGWYLKHSIVRQQLNSRFTPLLMILFRWVAPIGIGIVFVYELMDR